MNQEEILAVLNRTSVVITGSHFVYTSGKHGSAYFNKDALYPHTADTSRLCRLIAEKFADNAVEAVIAPAVGGIILSQWIAYHLSQIRGQEVLGVYAEKIEGTKDFIIKRGYDKLIAGKNVLVVEDVLNTGGSIIKVTEATRAVGGNVIGVGVLCNRAGITAQDLADAPKLFSLVDIKLDAWDEADCELCKAGVPINTTIGKGKEFVSKK